MDIKLFTYILLAFSIGTYFIPVENRINNNALKDTPLVIFEEPLMYTINEKSINRIVQSSHAVRYRNRDEMFNADIILKNNDEKQNFNSESLKADIIIKKGDVYSLIDNVKYKRDDFINLNTKELFYNEKTRIAYNKQPYDGNYFDNYVKGKVLYLDINNNFMKSQDIHFEIDMNKKEKGKK